MTFHAWKMVFLNSMTFHDFPRPEGTLLTTEEYPRMSAGTDRFQVMPNWL